jgi:hypothetical protein
VWWEGECGGRTSAVGHLGSGYVGLQNVRYVGKYVYKQWLLGACIVTLFPCFYSRYSLFFMLRRKA